MASWSRRLPTDHEILQTIFDLYYDEYSSFDENPKSRQSKVFVPVDIDKVAAALDCEPDLVFARLHFHLERRHGYSKPHPANTDGTLDVHFFAQRVGTEIDAINFPYMCAVLSELKHQHKIFIANIICAAVSALGALISAAFAFRGS